MYADALTVAGLLEVRADKGSGCRDPLDQPDRDHRDPDQGLQDRGAPTQKETGMRAEHV